MKVLVVGANHMGPATLGRLQHVQIVGVPEGRVIELNQRNAFTYVAQELPRDRVPRQSIRNALGVLRSAGP
jgi:hypothetical protein